MSAIEGPAAAPGELAVVGVSLAFGRHLALDDVTLAVPPGALAAVLGPSGSGKTTLLRVIAGFLRPQRGEVTLTGRTLTSTTALVPPEQRRIGIVPQEGALFPHLCVADNVGFGLARSAASRARVAELLEQVDLAGMDRRMPQDLSGGQQQRVALARALAPRPAFILLDEPFAALDAPLRGRMRTLLRTLLGESGVGALLVTHDQGEALSCADQVTVLRQGRVAATGSPEAVYRAPADPGTAESTGDVVTVPALVTGAGVAHTCLGEVALTGPARPVERERGQVWLRPEQVRLVPVSAAGGRGSWTVERIEFYGHDADVVLLGSTGDQGDAGHLDNQGDQRNAGNQGTLGNDEATVGQPRRLRSRIPAPVTLRPGDCVHATVEGSGLFTAVPR